MLKKINWILLFVVIILCSATCKQKKSLEKTYSIAFYNIDNLFDDIDDSTHNDEEFTPNGNYKWTAERYLKKLSNMEFVIKQIANGEKPDVLGICELESKKALVDLINTGNLKNTYGISHFDSPDERGIDVALIFNKNKFEKTYETPIKVTLSQKFNDATRDILYCKIKTKDKGEFLHFFVCHFPSRREGKDESEQNRIDAAQILKNYIDKNLNPKNDNIVIMGDFNDEPSDKSIKDILSARDFNSEIGELNNLMWHFKKENRGTYKFRDHYNTLDQFIVSKSLVDGTSIDYKPKSVNIMDLDWMKQTGKYAGFPLRTFGGKEWLNGYSDHFPIYLYLNY